MSWAAEPPAVWSPDLMVSGTMVTSVAVSPDGNQIAYVQVSAVMTEDESTYRNTIYVAPADASTRQRFTYGKQSASNPRWSPDGLWLAYTATQPEGKSNLVIIPSDGCMASFAPTAAPTMHRHTTTNVRTHLKI